MTVADEPPIEDVPPPDEAPEPPRQRAKVTPINRPRPTERQAPHNTEAEERLLGAMLLSRGAITAATEVGLSARDFYSPAYGHVYDAALTLYAEDKPVDPATVSDVLLRSDLLDMVGGSAALVVLTSSAPAVSSAGHFAGIIRDHAMLRRGLMAVSEAAERFYDFDSPGALAALQRAVDASDETGTGVHSWQPIDLQPIVEGEQIMSPPELMIRSDGQYLLYPGKVHAFNAESESGKTMVALGVCAERMWRAEHVLYIDFEDSPEGIVERLVDMGVERTDIVTFFHYVRPDDPFDLAAAAHISRVIEQHAPVLAVIDGVTEAMVMNNLELLDNGDIARFYAALPKRLARAGCCVVVIDHVPKDKTRRGKGGLGGQHKRAGIDGASYNLETVKPFARGLDGEVKLTVDKDRGGFIRSASIGGDHAANIRIETTSGSLEVHIDAPNVRNGVSVEAWEGPLQCMDAVEHFFAINPNDELSKNATCERLRVAGVNYRDRTIGEALERLAAKGVLTVRSGPRQSLLFRFANPEESRALEL